MRQGINDSMRSLKVKGIRYFICNNWEEDGMSIDVDAFTGLMKGK